MASKCSSSQISGDTLIKSLQKWCEDNGVKIRLTHDNHIVIQERIAWHPPEVPHLEDPPTGEIWVKDLVFIDRGVVMYEKEAE